ncbi:MAG: tetratricopeptide repeat protein [Variovorax sp.]|jgi:Flp pilus assembly protein TadD|nr:MAG: tetratricopeptide repeat protein [Variovorax sp.]
MKHAALLSFVSGPALRRSVAALMFPMLALAGVTARADEYGDVNRLLRQGSPAEALAKADAYIAGKPRDPQMRFLRGVILTEQGRTADATLAFTQLTQDFPELPEPYNNLAALYAQQSQFERARDALETAIRLSPAYSTAYENLGDVYARLAAQTYDRAQKLAPASATIAPKVAALRQVFATPNPDTLPAATPVPRRIPNNNR